MPKLTEEEREKTKGFAQKVGNTLWDSTAIAMVLILAMILICGTVFFFLLFYSAEEANDEYLTDEQARAYYPSEGDTCSDSEYGVDLADLGIKPLAYEAFYSKARGTEGYAAYSNCEYIFSTKDDLEFPAEEYTLHYEVWKENKPGELDKLEKVMKEERYGGEVVAATLDYGATGAYWLGDELLLCYDDYMILFYDDTTRELLESQACADFMRTEMKL